MEQATLVNYSTSTVHEIPSTLDKFLIGRGLHNSLVLDDMNVSRTHCILERNNGDWYISDKSSNGTWVNGKLVDKSKSQLLASGDVIRLSDTIRFIYNKTSQQIANSNSEKALSENDIMDIAESVIAEADALNAEFENDVGIAEPVIAEADALTSEFSNDVVNSANVKETNKGLNVVSSNGAVNIYYPAVVNIVQKSVPGQPIIPQLVKAADAQGESSSTQPEPVIQSPPKTDNSQEPSCSKDNSNVKTERNHFEQVEDELQCSICTEMFVKAVTLNCSHTFCKFCIAQWQKNQTICPICRTKITMQFPTLVVDNCIEKVIESASEEVKQHRRELIAEREAAAAASTSSNFTTSTPLSSPHPSRRRHAQEPIEIGSSDDEISDVDEEDEDDEDDEDECDEDEDDMSDEDDDMDVGISFDEWREDYNGVPGCYYGGYGRCYGCGQRGHWANGCPNRRKR